jgi:excisionase family DNA binding protein
MLLSPALPCSLEDFEFAVSEVLHQHRAALYPAGPGSGLSAEERRLLVEGGADLDAHEDGAASPTVRTAAKHAAILAAALSTAQAAERLGVSEMRVRQRLSAGSLRGISTSRGWRLPSFQFTDEGELPGWDRVAKALPEGLSPVVLLNWLEAPHGDLIVDGRPASPLGWLCAGHDPKAVVAVADQLTQI